MFARATSEPGKTRVVAQCRDADFERLVRSTFGMDGKVELSLVTGAFAAEMRKLDTDGATVVIVDVDPGSEADFAALTAFTQRLGGTPPVIVARNPSKTLAMPKSATFMCLCTRNKFCGLMSRCCN